MEKGIYLRSVNNLIKLSKLLSFSLDELAENALFLSTTILDSELNEKYGLLTPDEQGIVRELANALLESFIKRNNYT